MNLDEATRTLALVRGPGRDDLPSFFVLEQSTQGPGIVSISEQVHRYRFAARHAARGPVLDIAAGMGFGSRILEQATGHRTVGMDILLERLAEGRMRYGAMRFVGADGTAIPAADGTFGTVVSIETLEHVPDWEGFLDELCRVLDDDGTLVVSTPNKDVTSPGLERPRNPYHVVEFTVDQFEALLRRRFGEVRLHGQIPSPQGVGRARQRVRVLLERVPGGRGVLSVLQKVLRTDATAPATAEALAALSPQHEVVPMDEMTAPASYQVAVCRKPLRGGG